MSDDDLVKRLTIKAGVMEMGEKIAWGSDTSLMREAAKRIEELEAKLERISEEWAGAVYGDLENGVASLNAAAATDFYKRYPSISSFGDTLLDILLEGEDRG
jgi:hypothetical protein